VGEWMGGWVGMCAQRSKACVIWCVGVRVGGCACVGGWVGGWA